MKAYRLRAAALALMGLLGAACESEEPFPNPDELDQLKNLHTLGRKPEKDPTNRLADDAAAAKLGERLFHDTGLSRCGTVSCASCHQGEGYTVETATAEGCEGQRTLRNPPTLLNVGFSAWYMWDGRADRLWSQAVLPLQNPVEMNSDATVVGPRLQEAYRTEYAALFGHEPKDETDGARLLSNAGKLLEAYQRTLNRTAAPFDVDVRRFLEAVDAGTAEKDPAYLGLKTFVRKGQCVVCHKGPTLSDNLFHNIGVKDGAEQGRRGQAGAVEALLAWEYNASGPYSDDRSGTTAGRLGTLRSQWQEKGAELEGAFRTPSLRNVALTAPYLHTGALATLEDVVEFYNKGGDAAGTFTGTRTETIKELDLSKEEQQALVALLRSLTGEAQ